MSISDEEIQREDDLLIMDDVARAVEERELIAYFQPQYDINDDRMAAIEALVRWSQPDDGTVVPASLFVPSLERTNTILGLDWYMVEEAAGFVQRHRDGALGLPVSVNLSHWHLREPDFINILSSTVDWHEVAHERFAIEVSEAALAADEDAAAWVAAVRDAGFQVAIDDFGAASGSLELLSKISANAVKIGREYVARNVGSEEGRTALASLTERAHELGMFAIAQGIETAEERDVMRQAGFDAIQGYFYAAPMSEQELVSFS